MITEEDFVEVYTLHAPKVYKLCLGYASGNQSLAKDWQQETFMKVWNHRKSFKNQSSIGTWIYRIAVNVCLSDLRKTKKYELAKRKTSIEEQDSQEDEYQTKKITKMYSCIERLSMQNKTLILLELEDVPQATIAKTMGLAHGAVRTRLTRIRKTLLKCMNNGQ
ncbi:MAG: RNA polymerase sigma factor [Bacteroidota bacterium]